jgi:hypothetical protein
LCETGSYLLVSAPALPPRPQKISSGHATFSPSLVDCCSSVGGGQAKGGGGGDGQHNRWCASIKVGGLRGGAGGATGNSIVGAAGQRRWRRVEHDSVSSVIILDASWRRLHFIMGVKKGSDALYHATGLTRVDLGKIIRGQWDERRGSKELGLVRYEYSSN